MQTILIKIGTRSSKLALLQAKQVGMALMKAHGLTDKQIKICPMSTQGDRITDRPLTQIGGKGLFTQEIEQALLEKRIDIAVHSTKDMPTLLPEGLQLSTFLPREDPHDAFIGCEAAVKIATLPRGAILGTSSLRRQAFIRHHRPDLNIIPLRGNIETRLAKLQHSEMQGTFLAVAGLKRLGKEAVISEILPREIMLPAPGQGAIAIESRTDDAKIGKLLTKIGCDNTHDALKCERSFLKGLDGSCRTPLGGLAKIVSEKIDFSGAIASPDGTLYYHVEMSGARTDAVQIGIAAAEKLRRDAGTNFFDGWI